MKLFQLSQKNDTSKARIYYRDGHIESFGNQVFAYAIWLALPHGVRAAFRGVNDTRPVYGWDYADKQATQRRPA